MIQIFWIILGIDVLSVLLLVFHRLRQNRLKKQQKSIRDFITNKMGKIGPLVLGRWLKRRFLRFLPVYIEFIQSIDLPEKVIENLSSAVEMQKLDVDLIRRLRSPFKIQRSRMAVFLGAVRTTMAPRALLLALQTEKSASVRVHIINALANLDFHEALPVIVESLSSFPEHMKYRVRSLIISFGESFEQYLPDFLTIDEKDVQELLLQYAQENPVERMKGYVKKLIGSGDRSLRASSFEIFSQKFVSVGEHLEYLDHSDKQIRNLSVISMGNFPNDEYFDILVGQLRIADIRDSSIQSLVTMVSRDSRYLRKVHKILATENDLLLRTGLIEVISNRIEYFLDRIDEEEIAQDATGVSTIVEEVLELKRYSGIIAFLNRNRNQQKEAIICNIVRKHINHDAEAKQEFAVYLDEKVLASLALEKQPLPVSSKEPRKEKVNILILISTLALLLLLLGGGFVLFLRQSSGIFEEGVVGFFHSFLGYFLSVFAAYHIVLNGIYLVLLVLSKIEAKRQYLYGELKSLQFLFKPGVLPSISIIAPAYCEEATVVESVKSLLNLRYPDYELIVVNDGSTDATLETLLHEFELEKFDIPTGDFLKTQPVRGIYMNPKIPELLVIDKMNGGKADSLNAGINAARKEYFAGIDSDSLLERDSLLKVAGACLDSEEEVVASGGNIFPVNGCEVRSGYISKVAVPASPVALIQMVEYLRAFMNGRLGWSTLSSLLIISGAFGVFKRDRVITMGGYLTGRERYMKDTVGEDMELVVRIIRSLSEQRQSFKIQYVYDANCWTEVPESLKTLYRQRDRWQRGLIDILLFHKKLFFNKTFGLSGFIGFPYYFLFEIVGPWIENAGFLLLLVTVFTGFFTAPFLLYVFATSVMLGTAVSILSVTTAEKGRRYFSVSDLLKLIAACIAEGFGFRQIMNFVRIGGYINSMKNVSGWGKMVRKGFAKK